jgi:hypothetical protein
MSEEKFTSMIFLYVFVNLVLFILYRFTQRFKIVHRFLSLIDNLIFCLLLGYGFYRANRLYILLVPSVLLIVYPISWGLNRELSDEELDSVVILKSPFPIKQENRIKLKVTFAKFATFPFYYLLDSWSAR